MLNVQSITSRLALTIFRVHNSKKVRIREIYNTFEKNENHVLKNQIRSFKQKKLSKILIMHKIIRD